MWFKSVVFILFVISALEARGDRLLSVAVLYRHGDRTATSESWPTDIYYNKHDTVFPEGIGQLTNIGKQHHYELGQWLRQRYSNLLPETYIPADIHVRSTDVDRTLMSAQVNLAGLYPPINSQIWNSSLLWQPIPVHTKVEKHDPILTAEEKCQRHDDLYDDLLKSDDIITFNEKYSQFYKKLTELTGTNIRFVTDVAWIYSTLNIYKSANLTLPDWTDDYYSDITILAAVKFQLATFTTELARLRTGPFFNHLLNQFNTVIKSTKEDSDDHYKMLMYSAHDTTVADILNTMELFNDIPPQFCSMIIWELRESNEDNNVYLNIFFKNMTHFEQLNAFKECNLNCNFVDFEQYLEPIAVNVTEWRKECADDSYNI